MTEPRMDTDLIIAGGGLAGRHSGAGAARVVPELRVMVESFPLSPDALPDDYQPSYDARSTAAWGSRLIFEELGLWAALSEHATPIRNIHVLTGAGSAPPGWMLQIMASLGYVADNRWMGLCLMRALLEAPVSWQAPAEVVGMTPIPGGVRSASVKRVKNKP